MTPTDPVCGVIEAYRGAKTLKFWSTYSDPVTGTVAATIEGTTIATSSGSAANQAVAFTAGQAVVTAKYKDVGEIQISMVDDSQLEPVAGITGVTGLFVSLPADFVVTTVEDASTNPNPGASVPAGAIFVKAGEAFHVTLESRDSEGSLTPNYGNESTPEATKLTPLLVAPAGQSIGTIGNDSALSAIAPAGTFKGTTLYWDEVGAMQAQPSVADADYLGAGDVTGTTSATVGRFVPDHFDAVWTTPPTLRTKCSTFTYMGQQFDYLTPPVVTGDGEECTGHDDTELHGRLVQDLGR